MVKILHGKDEGRVGKVLQVFPKKEVLVVEGVNLVKRHLRKMHQTGGKVVEINKPINISNVALVCPKCKKATRVGFKIEAGKKTRICKECKEVI